jgi:YbbR domain-containing protein
MAWKPFRNLGLKAVALALGTLLWLTVSGRQIERRVPVPLSYSNVPPTLEMTGEEVADVSVLVRGGDNDVSQLGQGDLRLIVDLANAHAGANMIALRTDGVTAPLGIEVLQLEPGTITVMLEPSTEVRARVLPTVEGEPAPGYVVTGVTVDPATVTIVGPASEAEGVAGVVTERVSIAGSTEDVVRDVGVGVAGGQLRLKESRTVRVSVRIRRAGGTR